MLNGRTVAVMLIIGTCVVSGTLAQVPAAPQQATGGPEQTLDENWNDFLHYTMIGRLDLAKGYAQAILKGNPDPVALFELVQQNPQGYDFAMKVAETSRDEELAKVTQQLLAVIDQGRFARRTDPKIIVEEIRRLGSTPRGKLIAIQRLRDSGEYAVPFLLDAMAETMRDPAAKNELAAMIEALPQIGQPAIRPLAAALQMSHQQVSAEIVRALGQIGYPQALPYLKYVVENSQSAELRTLAAESLRKIDPRAIDTPAAALFFQLAEKHYYHNESLNPPADVPVANIWFWDSNANRLARVEVAREYFHELMCMRCCEWSLKAQDQFGLAIGLWLAAFFKAESAGIPMPEYFGAEHANALVYATTAGPEYLHQALARAVNDRNAAVALGAVEALATTAGERSLMYTLGPSQPLLQALAFPDRAVRYSAAIAIGNAGPRQPFSESAVVVQNLAEALTPRAQETAAPPTEHWTPEMADRYALESAQAMLNLAVSRNPVIDLSLAQPALIGATKSTRPEIQTLAGQVLAYINNANAQRAIAEMALNTANDVNVRVAAFQSLICSAKLSGNLLADVAINAIYELISQPDTDPALRAAAAAAYGALDLPSQKVKNLILDQAKS
jgi:HEAT repeat protein